MDSKSVRVYTFEKYPELATKIRNDFGMLGHQGAGIQVQIDDIFEKIRSIFFDPHLQNENIAQIIRSEPLAFFTKSVYSVLKHYEQNLDTIYKQSKQECESYKLQISGLKQQMSEYLTFTEDLKYEIEQLKLQKESTLMKLDQSESNLGLTLTQHQIQEIEKKKIEQERVNALSLSSKLEQEIATLLQQISQFQRREATNLSFKELYLLQKESIQNLSYSHNQALKKILQLQQDLQSLKIKYHEKSQLYERYVQEHNYKQRCPVYQYSSPALSRETFNQQRIRGHLQKSNELNGLVFNLTDSEEMTSKASQLSMGDNLNIIDYESTPYQLSKSPSCGDNRVVIEKQSANIINSAKKSMRVEQNTSKKYEINVTKEKSFKKNQMFSQAKPQPSNKKEENVISPFNPSSAKKINSLAKDWNTPNTKEYIDNILKEKLNEKNLHIQKLQAQLQAIRGLCLSQKQNFTMMQGEYQLKLQELKDLLAYTKNQLRDLFEKYCSNKALCECYEQKIDELQKYIQDLKQQFKQYSSLLQSKCKLYILTRIECIEQEYWGMVEWMNQNRNKLKQMSEAEVIKEEKGQNILIFDEQTQDYDSVEKVQSESDLFSLDFQKMKKVKEDNSSSEMFICDKLEIQSQLNFKMQNSYNVKGNFTQRVSKNNSNIPQTYEREKFIRRKDHLKINDNVIYQSFVPNKSTEWRICNLKHISIQRKSLNLQSKQWEFNTSTIERKPQKLKICPLEKISLHKKLMQLNSSQIKIKFEPSIRPKYLHNHVTTFSVLYQHPRRKQLQLRSVNIYHYTPKRSTFSITSVFDHTLHQQKRKPKLSSKLQEIITIPAHKRIVIDRCIETDNNHLQRSSNQQYKLENLQTITIQTKNVESQKKSTITQQVQSIIVQQTTIKIKQQNIIQRPQQQSKLQQLSQHIQTKVESNKQQQKSISKSNRIQNTNNPNKQHNKQMQSTNQILYNLDVSSDEQSDIEIIKLLSKESVEEADKTDKYSSQRKVQSSRDMQLENLDPNRNADGLYSKENSLRIDQETTVLTKHNETKIEDNQKKRDYEKETQNGRSSITATQTQNISKQKQFVHQPPNFECDEIVAQFLQPCQMTVMSRFLSCDKLRFSFKEEYPSIMDFFAQKRTYESTFYYIFFAEQKKTNTFLKIMISHRYMIELPTKRYIHFRDRKRFFDSRNFIFGQCEVCFFRNGTMEIHRKNKSYIMKGNIPDKAYKVEKIYSLNAALAK